MHMEQSLINSSDDRDNVQHNVTNCTWHFKISHSPLLGTFGFNILIESYGCDARHSSCDKEKHKRGEIKTKLIKNRILTHSLWYWYSLHTVYINRDTIAIGIPGQT